MRRAVNRIAIPVVAALALSACAAASGLPEGPARSLSRYTLQVEPGVDRIALAVHENGLSSNQQAALDALADRFAAERAEVILIEAPSGNDPVAAQAAWNVREFLARMGVPTERLLVVAYEAPNPRAPVLAGFETLQAQIPNCAAEVRTSIVTYANEQSPGFGCAVTANLAAQIANPRDILAPRGMSAPDMGRRAQVFDTYRAGELTSAPQETLVAGEVSQAVD
jgi:pilus assembly protein CpaD